MSDNNEIDTVSDVVVLMKAKLPPYVVRCFLAAGYDTQGVISSMNIGDNDNNSIDIIESYIQKYYAGNKDFYNDMTPDMQLPFVFSPGHRQRICSFVSEVKHKYYTDLNMGRQVSPIAPKKIRLHASSYQTDSDIEPEDRELTISSVSNQVRQSISKWVRKQPINDFKCLKENKHFIVLVSRIPKSTVISVSVQCLPCSMKLQLSRKRNVYLISNWTRHVRKCERLNKTRPNQDTKQKSLSMFLSPTSYSSSSSPGIDSSLSEEFECHVVDKPSSNTLNSKESELLTSSPLAKLDLSSGKGSNSESLSVNDWSRGARITRKLIQVCDDVNQTRITNFFSALDDIERLAKENKKLTFLLEQATNQDFCSESDSLSSLTAVLKQIILNAQSNTTRLPTGRRYPEVLKKFSTSLLIYAGPLSYDFLQKNLPHALPSLRTVQRIIHSEYKVISEGEFRFDDLVTHLLQYKAPKVVSIGEDATRLIARVEWDPESNRCCGFVLPINENGLPEVDSFLALTFEGIEKMFADNKISKYAYVYMVQPLMDNCPSFCLMVIGTDNKFTAKTVLLRWQYILRECSKLGIHVLSIGSDGDSRLLKAMKLSVKLFSPDNSDPLPILDLTPSLKFKEIPAEWKEWFLIEPTCLAMVQDTVHVAVKLKARLLRPSTFLSMGNYVASVQHLRMLQVTFGKDEHGLRERDINHKDKQNFNAVLNIIRASRLLDNIPDANATKELVNLIKNVIDSYMDKMLTPIERLQKLWYTVFFLRYWRQWIILHPDYTMENFISYNAYICIELNAHALLTFLITIRDHFEGKAAMFTPWLLGSQSCEKVFRSARSMTNTFSTMINFSMLGLLQRLHRLQIQSNLQAQSQSTGVVYPQINKHSCKDGKNTSTASTVSDVSNKVICETISQANSAAKASIESLGMSDLLKKNNKFNSISFLPAKTLADVSSESDSDEEDKSVESSSDTINNTMVEEMPTESVADVEKDIVALSEANLIDSGVKNKLINLKKALPQYKKCSDSTISKYQIISDSSKCPAEPISPFIKVNGENNSLFIRKTTALWLFQESECVSSDRLFRVRAKQPCSSENSKIQTSVQNVSNLPLVSTTVNLGDICVFVVAEGWKIGKVLQFSKIKGKLLSDRQYKGTSAEPRDNIGVLCSWFENACGFSENVFQLSVCQNVVHSFIPLSSYVCTLTSNCILRTSQDSNCQYSGIMSVVPDKMATTKYLELTEDCMKFIISKISVNHEQVSETAVWLKIDRTHLYMSDKAVLLATTECLNDNHMMCAQLLLKQEFPAIEGLQSTLRQQTRLQPLPQNSLQIVFINDNHWIATSTVNCPSEVDILVYDSVYCKVSEQTKNLLAELLYTNKPEFTIGLANVSKQSGSSDCGLFSVAYITDIAFGLDPSHHVYQQSDMRDHFFKCLEQKKMEPFPVVKNRTLRNKYSPIAVKIYCYCRRTDHYGTEMVSCDGPCGEWFHLECLGDSSVSSDKWYCNYCSQFCIT